MWYCMCVETTLNDILIHIRKYMKSKTRAEEMLRPLGITINGNQPWDIRVHDERLYDRVFGGGTLALGESYMDGWWDAEDLAACIARLTRNAPLSMLGVGLVGQIIKSKLLNLQSPSRAFQVGEHHYDLDNKLYQKMLDPRMVYSCAYWKNAATLAEAQEAKLDLTCRKIGLKKGDRVLDVGCGWGGFAQFASQKYGAHVVGLTVSKDQAAHVRRITDGLPVEVRLQDWRDIGNERFDHVVSVGMFEHVGPKNYRAYMQKIREVLKEDGLFLLHTIGHSKTTRALEPWFHKYIFPNGHLPSVAQIAAAFDRQWFGEPLFVLEDWHNFGVDYDRTLVEWYMNFDRAWPALKQKYDERFYRMWKYYLLTSAGMFRSRYINLWQIVLSPKGIVGGHTTVR